MHCRYNDCATPAVEASTSVFCVLSHSALILPIVNLSDHCTPQEQESTTFVLRIDNSSKHAILSSDDDARRSDCGICSN